MKTKNILLLITNLDYGGAQRVFYNQSIEFAKSYNIIECVFNKETGVAYNSGNVLEELKVSGGGSFLGKAFNFFKRIKRLRIIKKQHNINISISHLEGADYINILAGGNDKKILCIHGSKKFDKDIKGILGIIRKRILIPFLYRKADLIVTVSEGIKQELIREFNIPSSKVVSINNFFDVVHIQKMAEEDLSLPVLNLCKNHKIIITSGRPSAQKNQFPLIDIFKKVTQLVECKLIILGDGPHRPSLVDYAIKSGFKTYDVWDKLSFNNNYEVYFLGYQSNPFNIIARATIFAFPSAWEGFPMVLGETLACGTPIISADCPTGPREILSRKSEWDFKNKGAELAEYGILLPIPYLNSIKEINLWSSTIVNLLEDSFLRKKYISDGLKRVKDFEKEIIMKEWLNLLEQM